MNTPGGRKQTHEMECFSQSQDAQSLQGPRAGVLRITHIYEVLGTTRARYFPGSLSFPLPSHLVRTLIQLHFIF